MIKCEDCDGTNITQQTLVWIYVQGEREGDMVGDKQPMDKFWCEDCNDEVEVYEEEMTEEEWCNESEGNFTTEDMMPR